MPEGLEGSDRHVCVCVYVYLCVFLTYSRMRTCIMYVGNLRRQTNEDRLIQFITKGAVMCTSDLENSSVRIPKIHNFKVFQMESEAPARRVLRSIMIHVSFSACQGSCLRALMPDHGNFGILSHWMSWPSRALKWLATRRPKALSKECLTYSKHDVCTHTDTHFHRTTTPSFTYSTSIIERAPISAHPASASASTPVKVASFNARTTRNKTQDINHFLSSTDAKVIAISES